MAGNYTLAIRLDEDLEFGIRWGNEETDDWFELSAVELRVLTDDDGTGELLLNVPADVGEIVDGETPEWWYTILVPEADVIAALAEVLNGAMGEAYYVVKATRQEDSRTKVLAAGSAVIHRGSYLEGP